MLGTASITTTAASVATLFGSYHLFFIFTVATSTTTT